jgi:hypothetical protein
MSIRKGDLFLAKVDGKVNLIKITATQDDCCRLIMLTAVGVMGEVSAIKNKFVYANSHVLKKTEIKAIKKHYLQKLLAGSFKESIMPVSDLVKGDNLVPITRREMQNWKKNYIRDLQNRIVEIENF